MLMLIFIIICSMLILSACGWYWLPWMLCCDVREEFIALDEELRYCDWRFCKLLSYALESGSHANPESKAALQEARRVLRMMQDFRERLRRLVTSFSEQDWTLAEELLFGRTYPTIPGSPAVLPLYDWREQLERCVQIIGNDILKANKGCQVEERPIARAENTLIRELSELGIHSAIRFGVKSKNKKIHLTLAPE